VPESLNPRGVRARIQAWRSARPAGYAAAVGGTAVALVVTWFAQDQFYRGTFVLFYLAVSLTAWLGGLRPALVATLLSVLSGAGLVLRGAPETAFDHPSQLVPLVAFAAVGTLIGWLAETGRDREREFEQQSDALQQQYIELEQQMEESQSLQEELEETTDQLLRANEDLTRHQDFLAQAQSIARLGSWEWNVRSNTITWSDQMYRVYGLEPGSIDVSFEKFSDLVHPDDREMVQRHVSDALYSQQPFTFDHRLVWPDGTIRWSHSRGRVIADAAGEVVTMVGSGQDITERKRAADAERLLSDASMALASSLDYTQTLATVANLAVREIADWCSIAIGDNTGRHQTLAVAHRDPARVKWAEEYSRLHPPRFDTPTGVPQVLRTGQSEFYPEISRELLKTSMASEEEWRVVEELQMRGAIIAPMSARGVTIGAITFIAAESRLRFTEDDVRLAERLASRAAIAIDNARLFDEARTARVEAETANRAKADFLASMSHELRTPLNAIAGYAQLMEIEVLGPISDEQRGAIVRLQRSRQHLSALVDQVLNFARIEAGKVSVDLRPVPVHEALTQLGDMIAPQATVKGLAYTFDGCPLDLTVLADRDRFDQIILNLLTNAVKFTDVGGAVRVSVERADPRVLIHVEDTGRGIPPDKQHEIFHPFVQLAADTRSTASGVGLGLAISRDLARAMGGDILVRSEVGKGSVFTVQLPQSPEPVQ
jgi:PAS domain S-box-containing protein